MIVESVQLHTATASHAHDELVTKADLGALRSEMRWVLGLLFALVLANSARVFGIL